MARRRSKKKRTKGFRVRFLELKGKLKEKRSKRVILHKSFKRSFREDYHRDLDVPGMMYHIMATIMILAVLIFLKIDGKKHIIKE